MDGGAHSPRPREAPRPRGEDFRAFTRSVNPGMGRFLEMTGRDWHFVRARGAQLETADGRLFDDWVAGFGAFNLGHNPPEVLAAARAQLEAGAPNLYTESLNPYAGALSEALLAAAGFGAGGTCYFCNSGAEAIETLIKTAIAATGRARIVYAAGGFHGTTLGALACMEQGLYREPFEPVLARFTPVPFGDLAALEAELARGDVAGVLLEPIQVEAGVRVGAPEYLRGIRAACDRAGALMLLDEVQTGMGRTGALFAFQRAGEGALPDAFALAKSLGGGVVPIGATVMRAGVWGRAFGSYLRSEIHASTFGGNALCAAAALRALEIVREPAFLAAVRARGERLFRELSRALAGSPSVERVTGVGLLGAIRLREAAHPWLEWGQMGMPAFEGRPSSGPVMLERLARHRILAQVCAHDWATVRVEPPLTVDDAACERFVAAVRDAVAWLDEAAGAGDDDDDEAVAR